MTSALAPPPAPAPAPGPVRALAAASGRPRALDRDQPDESQRANILRDELRLDEGARLIGAVGRLWPQKRYEDLIRAAELLSERHDDTHLIIVGDGPLRSSLQRICGQPTKRRTPELASG